MTIYIVSIFMLLITFHTIPFSPAPFKFILRFRELNQIFIFKLLV